MVAVVEESGEFMILYVIQHFINKHPTYVNSQRYCRVFKIETPFNIKTTPQEVLVDFKSKQYYIYYDLLPDSNLILEYDFEQENNCKEDNSDMIDKLAQVSNRITPDNIQDLKPNHIFVFGSNLANRHGRGGAKTALKWGAIYGFIGTGLQGRTYGIPTKDATVTRTLTINEIRPHVANFITFAKSHPELTFLVTEIGCGLAGHSHKDIAPLFKEAINVENIHLPFKFWKEIL